MFALDASGRAATNYGGTVTFGASDPSAALPPPHTFSAAGAPILGIDATFYRLPPGSVHSGLVTITANDGALSGNADLLLFAPSGAAVAQTPALSHGALPLLALALAAAAGFALRRMRR